MTVADSSFRGKSSDDILKQIQEQTSKLETAEPEDKTEEQAVEATEEKETETQEEQQVETSEETPVEETKPESEAKPESLSSYRIKYKGKEVEIPSDKVKDYLQKGYRVEEKLKELNQKEKSIAEQLQGIDFKKMNEEWLGEIQKEGNALPTFLKTIEQVISFKEQETARQRKIDRALEREMSQSVPHWGAIEPGYHEYRDEGHDHKTAVALSERDLFASLYLESKQKGLEEGEKKANLKQKAVIPGASKKGMTSTPGPLTAKELRSMTSDQIAKALNLKFVKHTDW